MSPPPALRKHRHCGVYRVELAGDVDDERTIPAFRLCDVAAKLRRSRRIGEQRGNFGPDQAGVRDYRYLRRRRDRASARSALTLDACALQSARAPSSTSQTATRAFGLKPLGDDASGACGDEHASAAEIEIHHGPRHGLAPNTWRQSATDENATSTRGLARHIVFGDMSYLAIAG
jgi:hypothetical protein